MSLDAIRQKVRSALPTRRASATENSISPAAHDVTHANGFAFGLFRQLAEQEKDVFLSPVSVAATLGMALAGTTPGGVVEKELKEVVRCSEDELPKLVASLFGGADSDKVKLLVANSIWLDSKVNPEFKKRVVDEYKASVEPMPSSVDPVNKWVSNATEGMIPSLLSSVPDSAIALLLNAVFFKGAWTHPFNPEDTKDDVPFQQPGVETEKLVKMMILRNEKFCFGEAPLLRGKLLMVELPYGDKEEYTAVVVLPQGELTLDEVVASVGHWDQWISKLSSGPVKVDYLGLPRFKLEYGATSLKPALKALGLKSAWKEDESKKKFSRMSEDETVYIDDVVHKAAVEVTEEGTKAAAASAVVMSSRSLPKITRSIYVDAPFLFAIRNKKSGLLVFLGRVDDPK